MKVRTGFVSNSSSSSFICSIHNFENKPLNERVNISGLNDNINDARRMEDEEWLEDLLSELDKWLEIAEKENVCIFDVSSMYGTEDTVLSLEGKIPSFKILEHGE